MVKDAENSDSGLTLIGHAYSPSEAALIISALEGAGYDVFVPGYHMMANAQHLSLAIGGAKIMVPGAQAETAGALLRAISEQSRAPEAGADESAPAPRPNWVKRALLFIAYFFTGTAPADNSRSLTQRNDVLRGPAQGDE